MYLGRQAQAALEFPAVKVNARNKLNLRKKNTIHGEKSKLSVSISSGLVPSSNPTHMGITNGHPRPTTSLPNVTCLPTAGTTSKLLWPPGCAHRGKARDAPSIECTIRTRPYYGESNITKKSARPGQQHKNRLSYLAAASWPPVPL